ncbi:MAG: hypothetical protein HOQ05_04930 [Corynebacteriales bacterium]|nr:hypothetical protein [Mycobacteriales bacterium]
MKQLRIAHLIISSLLVFAMAAALLIVAPFADRALGYGAHCQDPSPPSWFNVRLKAAAETSGDGVPTSWGSSVDMARIACFESTFRTSAQNGQYFGLTQMNRTSVENASVSWHCYTVYEGCTKPRGYHQLLAALRYADSRYGSPAKGWKHIRENNWW